MTRSPVGLPSHFTRAIRKLIFTNAARNDD
jgi:hypothetical protein